MAQFFFSPSFLPFSPFFPLPHLILTWSRAPEMHEVDYTTLWYTQPSPSGGYKSVKEKKEGKRRKKQERKGDSLVCMVLSGGN